MNPGERYDVVVIGAGFAGLYALHRLREMSHRTLVLEAADDVGGVWYWNRYPGARCDVESLQYSYSFDAALEQEWEWTERYAGQPEILRYIQHVAERFELRRHIRFNTRVRAARFDDVRSVWRIETAAGEPIEAQHCVMATGALSVPKPPEIPGLSDFRGPVHHTGRWPHRSPDFSGQRVGVIGTGSSGIQAIPRLAEQAAHLVVFQRTANFSIPAWNRALSPTEQSAFKASYAEHRARAREVGTLYEFSEHGALEVSPEARMQEYQRRWNKGGVNFVHAFNDLLINEGSNETIATFVREQIRNTVRDPAVAESLCPSDHPLGTKRICVDTGYYETFNRPNVTLIDLKKTPIERFEATGARVGSDMIALDALVCATGYDALSGALMAIDITGRHGIRLQDKWSAGPRTLLGIMTAGFPNLFIITGPGSPSVLVNMIVGIEHHVQWITDCITHLRVQQADTIEATPQAEDRWVDHVNQAASRTLLPRANSWFLGANVPGKPRVFMPYAVRIGVYRRECQAVVDKGYEGFVISGEKRRAWPTVH